MSSLPLAHTPADYLPIDLRLHADVVDICLALQSRSSHVFLEAANRLLITLEPASLPAAELHQHSRKIIRLIETARDTLQAAGIALHLFTSCSAPKQALKEVYFQLLRRLKERQDDVDPALLAPDAFKPKSFDPQEYTFACRARELAISKRRRRHHQRTRSIVAKGGDDDEQGWEDDSDGFSYVRSRSRASTPPPSIVVENTPRRVARKHARTRDPRPCPLEDSGSGSGSDSDDERRSKNKRLPVRDENAIPPPVAGEYKLKSPPLTKRFGIFCTSKTSMHRPGPAVAMGRAY
ncbi:hypothetical protein MKEN_01139000 [Mycena kentingensis (nom. inval.)]|nr:hypothetical protein MKEN_01139000 [Mycena kentingensis (nom. inval.)]